ncbi:3-beta hydroxysteroid dehydrogenase [Leuconostoc mesenteroides subsp. jonggajibkimchii]|uniref:glucose 1-dehydrogenase n=1 Tax=Leuconostoc TaxID=1243 RepID=UPI000903C558|nr:glucose 1-dehydrogenase [Leuconostoc mesenteroides]APE76700.1 3-beta hydroxysteroid dehydrogenase [Leuconostoc mesenteroides subsp. jonggajibkimchii]QHM57281.1 3-alpha-(or 20-beta)-hydroxysteroid dehydrogenase [Leuconostoc mesenteroides]
MTDRLKNKVAIITGGISGIGKAIAEDFLAEGAKVVITGRRSELGSQVAAELGDEDRVIYLYQDISEEAEWQEVVEKTLSHFGNWNILVNNAGVGGPGKLITDTTLAEWQQVVDINLTGTFLGNKIALQKMEEGSIVNVSSVLGIITPMPGVGAYAASKGGSRSLTKSASVEAIKMGKKIRVNSVHPALVDTDIVPEDYRNAANGSKDSIPAIGKTVDVAKAVTYLASDESSYTTGSELVIDGGTLAGR